MCEFLWIEPSKENRTHSLFMKTISPALYLWLHICTRSNTHSAGVTIFTFHCSLINHFRVIHFHGVVQGNHEQLKMLYCMCSECEVSHTCRLHVYCIMSSFTCLGCDRLWVTDGIWKTVFPHCMFRVEVFSYTVLYAIPFMKLSS